MNAYIYQAALLCEDCAKDVMAHLGPRGEREDSDEYPKGPYADGGGEGDSPLHCYHCGEFLENPLTGEGSDYVCESIIDFLSAARGREEVIAQWADFYSITVEDLIDYRHGILEEMRGKARQG